MPAFVTAVRLAGMKPAAPDQVAAAMEGDEHALIDAVEAFQGPADWQVELRCAVRHDDLQGAIAYTALVVRRAIAETKSPVARISIAGVRD